jgi:cytochrome c oxidase cbb3-type subunit 4
MDLNDLRSAVTVLSLLVFIGILVWTYSSRRGEAFAAAAALPFSDVPADAAEEENNT